LTRSFDRAIIIVLDSVGVGELPDAAAYGDQGSNTLANTAAAVGGLHVPNLAALGLGNIVAVLGVGAQAHARGCYGKMAERSPGKDTTTGHWELAGLVTHTPFPTYPGGFPDDVIDDLSRITGYGILGNRAASGTAIIEELGEEHLRSGRLIVYTSADSVLQIAAHERIVPPRELYRICRAARELLTGEHAVSRVIARPFVGSPGHFVRTERRRDFSLLPPRDTLLDVALQAGLEVVGIGKIDDIFAHRGLSRAAHMASNAEAMAAVRQVAQEAGRGIVMANLVEFDMLYGHRNDAPGYARALEEFDTALGGLLPQLRDCDALFITADHGCDPTTPSTDHSREYVPLLATGAPLKQDVDVGTRSCYADLAATVSEALGIDDRLDGTSFLDAIRH
jgi:phosphopentomutase